MLTIKEKVDYVEKYINDNASSDKAYTAYQAWCKTLRATTDKDYEEIFDYIQKYGF